MYTLLEIGVISIWRVLHMNISIDEVVFEYSISGKKISVENRRVNGNIIANNTNSEINNNFPGRKITTEKGNIQVSVDNRSRNAGKETN
uniref:Uncharacterized protein n=1 Tax=Glossina austeni TaxID=7395 RepID=A0A1A9UKV9_GLOAU